MKLVVRFLSSLLVVVVLATACGDDADLATDDDPDPEHEPSRINEQIRKLLSLFDQSSYVGYTATPFANVLIQANKAENPR